MKLSTELCLQVNRLDMSCNQLRHVTRIQDLDKMSILSTKIKPSCKVFVCRKSVVYVMDGEVKNVFRWFGLTS